MPAARAREHLLRRLGHHVPRREEHGRIEVALHGDAGADLVPRLVERRAPIDADDRAARFALEREQRAGVGAEMDDRHAERLEVAEDVRHVRHHVLAIVVGGERSDPRIEELHRLRARFDLGAQIAAHHLGELAHEIVPGGGLAVHEALGLLEVRRFPALDEVAREGERRAREADERRLAVELAADEAERRRARSRALRPARRRAGARCRARRGSARG